MPAPKPILRCSRCKYDLSDLITTPWVRTCPECGQRFDPEFIYEGNPKNNPKPNPLPPDPAGGADDQHA